MDNLSKSYDQETFSMMTIAAAAFMMFCLFIIASCAAIIWMFLA